jgi:hypothetical protein
MARRTSWERTCKKAIGSDWRNRRAIRILQRRATAICIRGSQKSETVN